MVYASALLLLCLASTSLSAPLEDFVDAAVRKYTRNNPSNSTKSVPDYMPPGGVNVKPSDPPPVYRTTSVFDFQSLNLALNQEYIELDLFNYGLTKFSAAEFEAAGLDAAQQSLIQFMAQQEISHAELLTDILGPISAKQCKYEYPFNTVRQFLDFCQKLTRFGESGVYGFLPHLNSRPAAQLLLQSITTEARQQMIFRQFIGAHPMPVHFEAGIPQSWAWTMLSPYIKSCPESNPYVQWQNFPSLNVTNNPSLIADGTSPYGTVVYYPKNESSNVIHKSAISTNRTSLTMGGRQVRLSWEAPGKKTGYDGKFKTATDAGAPKYALWVSQLNATYTPLFNISKNGRSAYTIQPNGTVFPRGSANDSPAPGAKTTNNYIVNGTVFVAITDTNMKVTAHNLSLINPHVVAGPALYQAD